MLTGVWGSPILGGGCVARFVLSLPWWFLPSIPSPRNIRSSVCDPTYNLSSSFNWSRLAPPFTATYVQDPPLHFGQCMVESNTGHPCMLRAA